MRATFASVKSRNKNQMSTLRSRINVVYVLVIILLLYCFPTQAQTRTPQKPSEFKQLREHHSRNRVNVSMALDRNRYLLGDFKSEPSENPERMYPMLASNNSLPFTLGELGLRPGFHQWDIEDQVRRKLLMAMNGCEVYKNINFAGGSLMQNGKRVVHSDIGSKGKCCKICRETEGCGAWSWSTRTNNCYLKTPTGYRHQNMSWVRSGVVLNAKKGNSALVTSCSEDSEAVYWQPQLTVGDHALSKGFAKYLKTSHGSNNKFVIKDPTGSGSVPVIKTVYPAGCWSPSANCNGGALFYSFPEGKGKSIGDAVRLEYEVYFPKDFPWVKGGKLPGLNGGSTGCGGGANADKKKCMSARIMWRRNGDGEAYLYHPQAQKSTLCNLPNTKCGGNAGTSVMRGSFKFKREKWMKISLTVRMNDPGKYNGELRVDVDSEKVIHYKQMNWRSTKDVHIDAMVFATWFGGSDKSWAPKKNVEAYWRNIKMYKLD